MEFYPKVKKFVTDAFSNSSHAGDLKHFERTVFWLKQLRPDADEALCIAALAHDAERAFRDNAKTNKSFATKGFIDRDHIKHHSEIGANIIADFLFKENASTGLVEKVRRLISKHEVGGTDDENALKDADSLSYFENQVQMFITKKTKEVGKDKVREKFQWMHDRITLPKAKELAKPMYEQAIKDLENYGGK